MTGAELATYITRIWKRTDKSAELYEAVTDTVLDMKLRYSHDRFMVEAYSTSISVLGDYKIDVPSDFGHIVGEMRCCESNTNAVVLKKVSKAEFDNLYPNPNATGVSKDMPEHYCMFGEQFLFGPVPNKTSYSYEFSYSTESVETITAATADVPFSDRYRECLKFGTLMRLYAGVDDDEKAMKWKAFYDAEMNKIEESDTQNAFAPCVVENQDI
jgi:catechol 2,3-dioxygenase-like lactoylglutathione lyase family enzyme